MGSHKKLYKFYTGLDSYETFKAIFESFGLAVNNLVYRNSRTDEANILTADYVKRGPKRLLPPEMEFYIVLVILRPSSYSASRAQRIEFNLKRC